MIQIPSIDTRRPLSVLLAWALITFTRDLEREGRRCGPLPSLALWLGVLRVVDEHGIEVREMPERACLSKRAVRALVGEAERRGWVTVETDAARGQGRTVRLTTDGTGAGDTWRRLLEMSGERWASRLGASRIAALRAGLEGIVGQLALELPHVPIGYGPADPSITGGHGRDWKPVRRGDSDDVSALSLPALLSQCLVAFTMEYEDEAGVALPLAANVIRCIGSVGMPLAELNSVSEYARQTIFLGTLERHGYVVVERDQADPRAARVLLTPRGRQAHARHDPLLVEIEQRWQTRYGAAAVRELRESLEALAPHWDPDLPHHPR